MKKHDWKTGLALVAAGSALGLAAGVALADATSPGWRWGRENCAPWSQPPSRSRAECGQCCDNGQTGNQTNRDCWDFCNQVGWQYWLIEDPDTQ
ncbi:MAG: hypothetical protein ACKVS8_14025 [Phycisphaerales bacterium]